MSNILQYKNGQPFAFISYSSKDKATIIEDVIEIQKRGVNVWFDADLTVGTDWFKNEVIPKILQCKVVLFYVSVNSIQSKQVLKEIETALDRKKPIIPICILPTITTINNYLDEYSHELTSDIETAYLIADKISGDNTFIPHKTDVDYYNSLIEKGIKRLAPGTIIAENQVKQETLPVSASTPVSTPISAPEVDPILAPTPVAAPASSSVSNKSEPKSAPAPKQNKQLKSSEAPESIQDGFRDWLISGGRSENTAKGYITQLRGTIVRGLGAEDKISVNLFVYSDDQEFERVQGTVRDCPDYAKRNSSGKNIISASLKAYSEYLKVRRTSAPSLQPVNANHTIVYKHVITNTDVTYRIIRFKKSSGLHELFTLNMPITVCYKDKVHDTKIHSIELGRLSSVPFIRDIPVGTELEVTFDGVKTITLTEASTKNQK
ncbi:MAG TPA: TIR domain-containing protein [Mobilitalea sp.]|nr:TIR domain-containing protein [Mobilitalea sp.]